MCKGQKVHLGQLKGLEAEVEKLRDALERRKSKAEALITRLAEDEMEKIKHGVKYLWRKVKFISCEEEQARAIEIVYDFLGYPKTKANDPNHRASWTATYEVFNRRQLFQVRNTFTSDSKKLAFLVLEGKVKLLEGRSLPTAEEILKCALRTTKDMDLMEWYWTCLLPKCVSAKCWGQDQYLYKTPTEVI